MFDHTTFETAEAAAAAAGFIALPDPVIASAVAPPAQPQCTAYEQILDDLDARVRAGRWEDSDPPGTPA